MSDKHFGESREDNSYIVKSALRHKHNWGTPTGLGFFLISIGVFLYLLKLSGLL
jgi:hypothetical protein